MKVNFYDFLDTLKNTSLDHDNNEYMCQSLKEVINFEDFVEEYYTFYGLKGKCDAPADALYINKDSIYYLIEFKNGVINSKTKRNIKDKMKSSILSLIGNIDGSMPFVRERVIFILVYNEKKNEDPLFDLKSNLAKKAGAPIYRFDLKKYKGIFFENVFTYNENEFNTFVSKIIT